MKKIELKNPLKKKKNYFSKSLKNSYEGVGNISP